MLIRSEKTILLEDRNIDESSAPEWINLYISWRFLIWKAYGTCRNRKWKVWAEEFEELPKSEFCECELWNSRISRSGDALIIGAKIRRAILGLQICWRISVRFGIWFHWSSKRLGPNSEFVVQEFEVWRSRDYGAEEICVCWIDLNWINRAMNNIWIRVEVQKFQKFGAANCWHRRYGGSTIWILSFWRRRIGRIYREERTYP